MHRDDVTKRERKGRLLDDYSFIGEVMAVCLFFMDIRYNARRGSLSFKISEIEFSEGHFH